MATKFNYLPLLTFVPVFQVPAVQFAVASDSNYTFSGILGLGYTYPYSIPYPSVLNLMVAQELIGAPIFSLGLGGEMDGFSEWRHEDTLAASTDRDKARSSSAASIAGSLPVISNQFRYGLQ